MNYKFLKDFRQDFKKLTILKREIDLRYRYDDGNSKWYKGDKLKNIKNDLKLLKKLIIELGNKYKRELEGINEC